MIFLLLTLLFNPSETDFQKTWNEMQTYLKDNHEVRSIDTVVSFFLGRPYLVGSLETEGPETLRYHLDGFDCFTLTESALAFCLLKNPTQQEYEDWIRRTRYRKGIINGYESRIHYATEWVDQAVNLGLLEDATPLFPDSTVWEKKINFMTTHRKSYPKLADEKVFHAIEEIEVALSPRKRTYLPMKKVPFDTDFFKKGDIVLILTAKKGLDAGHFCYVTFRPSGVDPNQHIPVVHASSTRKEVVLVPDILKFLQRYPHGLGIMVFRLKKN